MANASSVSGEPKLPLDLEHRIFEIAAMACPVSIPRLMLVAWRVKDWVEPLLYRVVFLPHPTPRKDESRAFGIPTFRDDAVQQCPSTWLQQLKHLYIGHTVKEPFVTDWLSACSGVTNLSAGFYNYSPGVLHALGTLHSVQYLTIDVRALFHPEVPHSLFLTVTHLDLFEMLGLGTERADSISAKLALMPHLTHFAYWPRTHGSMSQAGVHTDTRLKCIVFLSWEEYPMQQSSPLLDDSRFVAIQQKSGSSLDWLRGAVGAVDRWALADAFIAARQAGKVERSRYQISDSETENSWWI
ncbi:hypothetical protein MVEN_00651600 [Mycena venus]|uniref:Uncharacterized protein n=1 Tax=Mycena venus TaxID=2733690 RepID=A0A8H6YPW5_9AGAR|nr:hypothetical protein MVEN_00651600 [Mycena venus]